MKDSNTINTAIARTSAAGYALQNTLMYMLSVLALSEKLGWSDEPFVLDSPYDYSVHALVALLIVPPLMYFNYVANKRRVLKVAQSFFADNGERKALISSTTEETKQTHWYGNLGEAWAALAKTLGGTASSIYAFSSLFGTSPGAIACNAVVTTFGSVGTLVCQFGMLSKRAAPTPVTDAQHADDRLVNN